MSCLPALHLCRLGVFASFALNFIFIFDSALNFAGLLLFRRIASKTHSPALSLSAPAPKYAELASVISAYS